MVKLDLIKDRKFGDNISMAFEFIKQNADKCKTMILILLGLAAIDALISIKELSILFSFLFSIVAYFLAITYATSYMDLYIKSSDDEDITEKEALMLTKQNVGKIIRGSLLMAIGLILGTLYLVIPGIYIWISCSCYAFCILYYNLPSMKALTKSHDLVRRHWWVTFCYLAIIASMLLILVGIDTLAKTLFDNIGTFGLFIETFIIRAACFILNLYSTFALGVYFYNLVDKNEKINITQKIDSIGKS